MQQDLVTEQKGNGSAKEEEASGSTEETKIDCSAGQKINIQGTTEEAILQQCEAQHKDQQKNRRRDGKLWETGKKLKDPKEEG